MSTSLPQALALLEQLIATPRPSRHEGRAADLLQDFMQQRGLEPRREKNNVWALAPHYDEHRPTLMLCAHIDTVRPVAGWQRDPFTPQRCDGRLYGLGSNDDGASLVSLLFSFALLREQPLPYNLLLLCSAEEEVSGRDGVEWMLPRLPRIDVALVGEPTGLRPAVAEKGLLVLDVKTRGKAGHAARGEGINAIYRAVPDLLWLRDHRFERVSPLLGPVKMTVTGIQAGTQHNVVPDECTMLVDVRPNECYTLHEVYDEIVSGLSHSEATAHSFRLQPSHIDPAHPLAARAVALCGPAYGSPTLSDQALLSCPSLKLGPGQSARSHTADEYIEISELEQALELYPRLLSNLTL